MWSVLALRSPRWILARTILQIDGDELPWRLVSNVWFSLWFTAHTIRETEIASQSKIPFAFTALVYREDSDPVIPFILRRETKCATTLLMLGWASERQQFKNQTDLSCFSSLLENIRDSRVSYTVERTLDTLLIHLEINHELAVYPRKKLFTKENRDSSNRFYVLSFILSFRYRR